MGMWWRLDVGGRPAEILALPAARVGAQSPSWKVTRADVLQTTPNGAVTSFEYRHAYANQTLFLAPSIGLLRGEEDGTAEYRPDGALVRRTLFVRYLVSSSGGERVNQAVTAVTAFTTEDTQNTETHLVLTHQFERVRPHIGLVDVQSSASAVSSVVNIVS